MRTGFRRCSSVTQYVDGRWRVTTSSTHSSPNNGNRSESHNLKAAGFAHLVTVYQELSELCLPRFLKHGHRYDFAFVDGWHTFDHVLTEFFYISRMLDVGGVVVFDDAHLPSIQKVLAHVDSYDCYERLAVPEEFPTSMSMKVREVAGLPPVRIAGFVKTTRDERAWDWYRDF